MRRILLVMAAAALMAAMMVVMAAPAMAVPGKGSNGKGSGGVVKFQPSPIGGAEPLTTITPVADSFERDLTQLVAFPDLPAEGLEAFELSQPNRDTG